MACFLVPAAEAAVVTIVEKAVSRREKEPETVEMELDGGIEEVEKIPFSRKLRWLSNLLWGGALLLMFEHLWHGEVVPWFPFLTAAADPADAAVMLHEMATVGVTMAVVVTAAWLCMIAAASVIEKRAVKTVPAAE